MPDKKLTDTEIKKALECCCGGLTSDWCDKCPMNVTKECDKDLLALEKLALGLINRLQKENEELIHKLECLLCHATGGKLSKHTYPLGIMESYVNDTIQEYCEEAQAEAYKEFAERFKKKLSQKYTTSLWKVYCEEIDNLLKELVGE